MVNYMPIVPVGLLDVLDASKVKDVFLLADMWKDKKYREFYSTRQWNTVILDNNLYEMDEPAPFDDMLQIARQISANRIFVVGPEDLSDGIETGRMTISIIEENGGKATFAPNIKLMCILHEKPNEMLEQLKMVRKYDDLALGISIFSYRLGYNRGDLAKFLKLPDSQHRYMHAFGWDNILEMYGCREIFDSVDSSMAATAARNMTDLKEDWQKVRLPGKEGVLNSTRYDTADDGGQLDAPSFKWDTFKNIQFLRDFCQDPYQFGY